MDTPYNLLPARVKMTYQIVYSELVQENLTIFKNRAGKWGALLAGKKSFFSTGYQYLVAPLYDSIGFNKKAGLLEVVRYENGKWNDDKNIFYFFNTNGELVWEAPQGTSVSIDQYGNVIIRVKKKHGLADHDFTMLVEPVYERLTAINDQYFIAYKDQQYGIIDRHNRPVLNFHYAQIFEPSANEKLMVKDHAGRHFAFDLATHQRSLLPFNKILRASSNTYMAPAAESRSLFKSIVNCSETSPGEYEMCRYKGKWGIARADGNVQIPNEYDYIDFLSHPGFYKVCKGDMQFREGDAEDEYRLFALNGKWGIIDANNNVIVPIEYDWIDEAESSVWIVYQGGEVYYNDEYQEDYWTIKGAKLGVYNRNKLIVPIAYDTILRNWFRVKDYIFVQNGHEGFNENVPTYDVYTFDGQKIEKNKPHPKNHRYYPR